MSPIANTRVETPFLGLRYFDEEHSHLFFGRDEQVNDILERLRRSRLVMVMGSSGSGKSSLVRAGVLPRLKAGFLGEMGSRWRIVKMRPGSSPIAGLARETQKSLGVDGVEVTLRRGPLGLVQAISECQLPADHAVLVIADQFEELFRYQRESQEPEKTKEEAASFVKLLLEATNQRDLPIYVIATMRSDYLGNCAQFRDLPERINDGLYLVPRMRRDQLEQAITGPLAVEDAEIAPRLVQKLLNDTGDDPDQLPVLQHTLLRAWNTWNHAPRPLDLEDLGRGGMQDNLSLHADEIYATLSTGQQRVARVLFQQLCERDAEGREIRRPAPVALVASVAGTTTESVEEVVAEFAAPEAALLYRNEDGQLDITHESLIRKWTRIQGKKRGDVNTTGWMQEEVDARDQFRLLIERAQKKDPLMGRALDDAIKWRELGLNEHWGRRYTRTRRGETAIPDVLRFIGDCEKEESARRRRRKRFITGGVTALLLALAVFAFLWISAEQQRENAERQARAASVALSQASVQEAVRLVDASQPGQALAHLARALRSDPDSLLAGSWISDLLLNERAQVMVASLQHEGDVRAADFSPDGSRVVTASDDNTARVWDAASGQPVGVPLQHQGPVRAAAFSPDGRRVVTASADNTARVWDAASGQPVGAPLQHQGPVRSAAFSPDGHRLVTASADNSARVWDAATGQPLGAPLQHQDSVSAAAFSPDGRRIVTISLGTARVWNAATGRPVGAPLQHPALVNAAAFSPDGRALVTASSSGTARVWDAATGRLVGPLQHQGSVNAAAFSPDGRRLVTASDDNTARVWDAETGQPVGMPLQHQSSVYAAAFSPDGRRVVTASFDTARVWNAATGQPLGAPLRHQGFINAVAFSPDGRRVVTASVDDTARVWDVATGQPVGALLQHQNSVNAAAFSPDGRRVVTASFDDTARVWDAATGQPLGAPLQHQDSVNAAAFSPDGRRVVTASDDNTARVWDAATGQPVGMPLQHQSSVYAAAFSPDGSRVVTASDDNTARIWDAATGQPLGAPLQHQGSVDAVAFSPDGSRVVTASDDNTARVWDAATGQPLGAPLQHKDPVNAAAFSPDGRWVVTGSNDDTARVWDAATGQPLGAPLQHQGSVDAVAFSPDGRRVVTASNDNTARVWDAATGQPLGAPLQHQDSVSAAAFSPDGRRVVTASDDNTARVWDAATGTPVGAPLQHPEDVNAAAFSPDGRRVITASSDDTARVWQVLLDVRTEDIELFADLAEVVGGYRVADLGSVVLLEERDRLQRVRRLAGPTAPAYVPFEVLLRRFRPAQR